MHGNRPLKVRIQGVVTTKQGTYNRLQTTVKCLGKRVAIRPDMDPTSLISGRSVGVSVNKVFIESVSGIEKTYGSQMGAGPNTNICHL